MPPQDNESNQDTAKKASRPAGEGEALEPAVGMAQEFGGPKGLEPTRYGDWERNGRCYDF